MNPSRKGFSYEREISKKLSLWITEGGRDDVLWRTEGSGGRFTNQKGKVLNNSVGDIGVKDPSCKQAVKLIDNVVIECKKGYSKDIDVLDLLDRKKGVPILQKWLDKLKKEAILTHRRWCWIILRRNNRHDVIFTYCKEAPNVKIELDPNITIEIDLFKYLRIFRLDVFLQNTKWKDFIK